MTMQEENSESNLTTADTGLTNYVGKWYASNLDGSPAFRTEPYLDDVYQSIFGLELELIQIDNAYYAYLYSNLHFFDYGFAYQTLNGDPLVPVAQIDESSWEIRYDETDPSSEDHRIIGNPIVTLSINPLGELYVEITEAETPIERTKLYSSEEWLNGQYADYDQEQSFSTDWNEEGETYDCTVFDCARLLSENAYGRWYADPFIYDIESGEIRIKSCQSSYFRGMTDLTVVFSLQSDPEENHTLYIDYESYAEIDGIPAERVS